MSAIGSKKVSAARDGRHSDRKTTVRREKVSSTSGLVPRTGERRWRRKRSDDDQQYSPRAHQQPGCRVVRKDTSASHPRRTAETRRSLTGLGEVARWRHVSILPSSVSRANAAPLTPLPAKRGEQVRSPSKQEKMPQCCLARDRLIVHRYNNGSPTKPGVPRELTQRAAAGIKRQAAFLTSPLW